MTVFFYLQTIDTIDRLGEFGRGIQHGDTLHLVLRLRGNGGPAVALAGDEEPVFCVVPVLD